ncbi:MAG: diacylglycerol kinase family lipid kinase [Glaciimonas sp.]|nr:diacylglycerol kinase family lipid kinase [Glaciimonas sp.]
MNSIPVVINAASGNGHAAEWVDTLAAKFRASGLNAHITLAKSGDEIALTVQRALAANAPIIVAGGGDGTINKVASMLVGSGSVLGVLPLGTLNHFAKDLGIPLQLDEAIEHIAAGHTTLVDTGEVNGKIFLNNSSLGLYPDIVREREKQQQRLGRGKWLAFFWASMMALRRFPFLQVRLSMDGKQHLRRTAFVFIGNNAYLMEGFNIGARTCLNTGQLSLYVSHHTGRFGILRLAISALFGRIRQAKDFDVVSTKEILIETHHKHLRVATDGEVNVMETPLQYRIRPAALRVLVPRSADNTDNSSAS